MDDPKKLQREVLAELDGLAQLVQREQSRQTSEITPPIAADEEEVSKLKQQMEELHERFIDLCARIESREGADLQPPRGEGASRSKPLQKSEIFPIRGFAPSDEMIRPLQLQEAKKARLWRGAALMALLAGGLAIGLRFGPLYFGVGRVAIESEPAEADVYIDDQFRGQTPLELKSIRAGTYRVRITKEGYETLLQEVRLSQGETVRVDVGLNELSPADLQRLARSLFNQGKLREADRICTLLFKNPPYDAFALDLKEKILTGLLVQINPQGLPGKTGATERISQPALAKEEQSDKTWGRQSPWVQGEISSSAEVSHTSLSRTRQDVPYQRSIQAKPAAPARTFEARAPISQASAANTVRHQPDPIDTEALSRIRSRIQSKNFAEARALLQQLPETSHPVVELKNRIELAETDVQKRQSLVSSALQKAESALIVGHYISPPNDNVVIHCNRGLSFDPQNQRLLALKKEVIHRSIDQARDWIQRGKFEQARLSFSTMNYLSQTDKGFPFRREWFQKELNKLEFTSYPVIHEHRLGSCNGRLRMNAHVLSFVASGDSSHGFTESLRNVVVAEAGETLRIRLDGKTYQFHPNSNQESASNRQAFQAVYEQLMNLVAKSPH